MDKLYEEKLELAVPLLDEIYSLLLGQDIPVEGRLLFGYVKSRMTDLENMQHCLRSVEQLQKRVPAHLLVTKKDFEDQKKRVMELLPLLWDACLEWYVRRYLVQRVREQPALYLSPELMKLMRQEKHPTIKPMVEEPEEVYARFFPGMP